MSPEIATSRAALLACSVSGGAGAYSNTPAGKMALLNSEWVSGHAG